MGSIKQAAALIALHNRTRRMGDQRALTADEESRMREAILAADNAKIQEWFAEVNAELGFDRDRSPATPAQLAVLHRYEARLYGRAKTTFRDGLSFEECHKRIETLKRMSAKGGAA